MLAVETAMRAYAPRFGGDVELWGLTGLLHDLDYERHPSLEDGHPRYALKELEARGIVDRHVYTETPVRVEYELTPMGHGLAPCLTELKTWADRHLG